MTTSQPAHRASAGSPMRRAFGRSLHALRKLNDEHAYAWDRYLQIGLPEARAQVAAKAHGGRASRSGSAVQAGADSGDRAA